MNHIRSRLTYSNVIASIALFAALGGGAYAAATVGPGDIENDAVRGRHIANNAVNSKQVGDLRFRRLELINGWETDFNGRAPAFAIDAQGVVHLRGRMTNRTCEILICRAFDLPAAIRPPKQIQLVTRVSGGTGSLVLPTEGPATVLTCLPEGEPGGDACNATELEGLSYVP
jgi:hypothetical protein